ncbi:MAG: hypothetical protein ABI895_04320 [Deltaproteobacteria bacterium]
MLSRTRISLLWLCTAPLLGCGGKKNNPDVCSELRACGGDVLGSWQVDALCPDPMTATQLLGAQLPAACQDAVQSVELPSYELALEYTATTRSVTGTAALNARMSLSQSCVSAATQLQLMLTDTVCGLVGSLAVLQLRANVPDAMLSCTLADGNCACDLTGTLPLDSTASYIVRDNQLVEGDSAQDYCVSGDQLALRSVELGQLHAHRQ